MSTETHAETQPEKKANWEAFEKNEVLTRADHFKRGIFFGAGFMVAGATLDYFVYPQHLGDFFLIRIFTFALLLLGLIPLTLSRSTNIVRLMGHWVVSLPMLAIMWMIYSHGDGESPYYAGLNLVLVGASLLLRWRFIDSVFNACICLVGYIGLLFLLPGDPSILFNNAYFIMVTAVFACAGTYFYNQHRFREFVLRDQLDASRRTLEKSNIQLQELSEAKTRFFANISHELRTPLTLILGPVEQLKTIPSLRSDPKARETLETLSDNGLRLLRLINDLLDLVRLDTGDIPLRPEEIDLPKFLDSLGNSFRPMAETQQISFKVESDLPTHSVLTYDRDQLEKIIMNLSVNALKFTPAGGRVKLGLTEDTDHFILTVSDTGRGMNEQELEKIFDRFYQTDASSKRKARGTGIGLALVQSLTKNLGGEINVKSELGKGTTFTIRFPITLPIPTASADSDGPEEPEVQDGFDALHEKARLAAANPEHQQTAREAGRNEPVKPRGNRPRILIVDDEPGMRSFIASQLPDYDLLQASDGKQGWELAKQHQPDLIVLDLMMPEMDGMEVCQHLRKNPGTARIPIVLVTAHAGDAPRLEALRAGVNDFLTKPFSSIELQARVRNLLLSGKYERDLATSNKDLSLAMEQLKENEEHLVRSEKLSSLGRMSAGIVHEINNPLNYTKTSIHILKSYRDLLPDDERADYDDTIVDLNDGVQRVIDIITDLRTFTRGDETTRHLLQLHKVVENTRRLMGGEFENIDFTCDVPEDLELEGNDNQLCQALINLIQNALHAIAEVEKPKLSVIAKPSDGGGITLEVSDNGVGISPENKAKIFDPFFTTRDVGDGMGLGLSLTLRIIDEHGGNVHVESEPGQGTTFSIFFPPALDADI
jgi:signal transduction histidine kinase